MISCGQLRSCPAPQPAPRLPDIWRLAVAQSSADKRQLALQRAPGAAAAESHPVLCSGTPRWRARGGGAEVGLEVAGGQRPSEPLVDGD